MGRFVWASKMLDAYAPGPPGKSMSYAFEILDKVGSQEYTWWSIVYDIANRRIHFRTKTNPSIRFLDLAAFDFSCDQPVKTYDLDSKESGDVSEEFEDYSCEKNRALIMKTFSQTEFLKEVTPDLLEILARYPESLSCVH
ncbi:MAG: hypothetical protein GTO29_13450 [Candidatus Latescibacteria bacterium]|nr:hypothetical protein [Candidatus Latescibacterota bacterium]NIO57257.1 hypothetical protein [Candidatus Latescibacterota bacterium]